MNNNIVAASILLCQEMTSANFRLAGPKTSQKQAIKLSPELRFLQKRMFFLQSYVQLMHCFHALFEATEVTAP